MTCDKCGGELVIGSWPFCPDHTPASVSVIGDEIDFSTDHITGHMKRYRSRERLKQDLREHHLMPFVRHTDGSKEVKRWV